MLTATRRAQILARLDEHVIVGYGGVSPVGSECWVWSGTCGRGGYSLMSIGGRQFPAYRASYRAHVGEIPRGYDVDHLCQNPSCVNPEHLEAVTPQENRRRVWSRITICPNGHHLPPYVPGVGRTCTICTLAALGMKNRHATSLGAKGGRARARVLTPERRREIARKAANARWGNKDEEPDHEEDPDVVRP